jgi:hypothetical protein
MGSTQKYVFLRIDTPCRRSTMIDVIVGLWPRGIGIHGWAENTGDGENFGGVFLAEVVRDTEIRAQGGPNGLAG